MPSLIATLFVAFWMQDSVPADPKPEPNPAKAAADAQPKPVDVEAVEWLDKLEQKGREVQTFGAKVVYTKADEFLGDKQVRKGELVYAAANAVQKKPTRFAVRFDKYIVDGVQHDKKLEIAFDGAWLLEIDYTNRRYVKRQLVAPGEEGTLDPLSIDGPFPITLGQKRDSVIQRFDVEVVPPDAANDPKDLKTVHLKLTPRADAPRLRDQKRFDRVDFWFDRRTLLPVKVETQEGAVRTTVLLQEAWENEAKEVDKLLDVTPKQGDWHTEVRPWEG